MTPGALSPATATFEWIRSHPVEFARDVLRFVPWSKQREILEAVRDHERVSVRSCHASGKSAIAAVVTLWWLARGPGSLVLITSATDRQLRKVVWREIPRRFRAAAGSGVFDGAELTDVELKLAEDWFALGLSTNEPENFAGWHGESTLVIVDEASGVSEDIFDAIEGLLAGGDARLLLLGNPTKVGGQFFRSHRAERDQWKTISISAFDTPAFTGEPVAPEVLRRLVKPAWVERNGLKHGESSAFWSVRVLGQFPDVGDDGIMALTVIDEARGRELPAAVCPLVVAVDVARYGDDETVIVSREGPRVRVARSYVGRDLMQTVGEATLVAQGLRSRAGGGVPVIVVDDAGLGGGVTDRLRQLGEFRVFAFNGAGQALKPEEYANRRAEAHFAFRDLLPELDLDQDGMLRDDLAAPRYRFDSRNRLIVESKDELKKRLGRSPDRGDAAVMLAAAPTGDGLATSFPPLPISGDLMTRQW